MLMLGSAALQSVGRVAEQALQSSHLGRVEAAWSVTCGHRPGSTSIRTYAHTHANFTPGLTASRPHLPASINTASGGPLTGPLPGRRPVRNRRRLAGVAGGAPAQGLVDGAAGSHRAVWLRTHTLRAAGGQLWEGERSLGQGLGCQQARVLRGLSCSVCAQCEQQATTCCVWGGFPLHHPGLPLPLCSHNAHMLSFVSAHRCMLSTAASLSSSPTSGAGRWTACGQTQETGWEAPSRWQAHA